MRSEGAAGLGMALAAPAAAAAAGPTMAKDLDAVFCLAVAVASLCLFAGTALALWVLQNAADAFSCNDASQCPGAKPPSPPKARPAAQAGEGRESGRLRGRGGPTGTHRQHAEVPCGGGAGEARILPWWQRA